MSRKWSIDELKDLEKNRDELLTNLVQSLIKDPKTIFAAKFGFGFPPMDIIEVTDDHSKRAYSVKLPLLNGELSSLPYYQGFGEAIFFLDQMIDLPYLVIPDTEVKEFVPFISGVDSIKRWKSMTTGVGLVTFDKSYNLEKVREPRYPTTKKYIRLELELADIILKYGEIKVRKGKEPKFERYKRWVKKELEEIGDKRIMAEDYARIISEKVLREEGVYGPTIELKEDEVESRPYPIPIFVVEGEGNHLGNNERFRLVINRITGNIIDKSFK
ncbi:MAG: hypothetical protein ACE5HY_03335 [Candidatus Hydrothermarchaeales archaeon]